MAIANNTTLECWPPKGLPAPSVYWKKDGEKIHSDGRITIHDNGNLEIENARKEDAGVYICVAHNVAGEKESTPARLEVHVLGKRIIVCDKYCLGSLAFGWYVVWGDDFIIKAERKSGEKTWS